MDRIRDLYYKYINNTGKEPRYLFVDKFTYEEFVDHQYLIGVPIRYYPLRTSVMGMEVIIVIGKQDFIWVG